LWKGDVIKTVRCLESFRDQRQLDGLRALIDARQGGQVDSHDTMMHGWTADQRVIAEQWVRRAVSFVRKDSDPEDLDVEDTIDYV